LKSLIEIVLKTKKSCQQLSGHPPIPSIGDYTNNTSFWRVC